MRADSVERSVARRGRERAAGLAAEPDRGRTRGVVHTPVELARFVVRSVDRQLRERFGLASGIADPRVALIDPACGPGAFLAAALAVAGERGGRPRRALGIDIDASAVAVAQSELGGRAAECDWPLELRVADTLATLDPFGELPPDTVVAVVGNPPWAGRSANRDAVATAALLDDFRRDAHGERLDERKIGVLSDDYVRFTRWSCELVRRAASGGVLGLVANASFLDGPVHRGMRGALTRWFDTLEVVDLGGSSLVARGAAVDENVFGVRTGVAVLIAARDAGGPKARRAATRHARLHGTRAEKLTALAVADGIATAPLACEAPAFALARRRSRPEYGAWPSLAEVMPFHAEGVQTNRDAVAVDADRERLLGRLRAFATGASDAALAPALAALPHYDPKRARARVHAALLSDPDGSRGLIRPVAYRPFDVRFFATVTPLCHRPRPRLLAAIDERSPVLYTTRKDRGDRAWACFGAGRLVPDNCFLSSRSSCRTRAYPVRTPDGRENLAPDHAGRLSDALGLRVDAEGFLLYALAVLAAPLYRERYDGDLHIDHPRIAPPLDRDVYLEVRAAGAALLGAFETSEHSDDPEVVVGHRLLRSAALASAIAQAERAVAPVVSCCD